MRCEECRNRILTTGTHTLFTITTPPSGQRHVFCSGECRERWDAREEALFIRRFIRSAASEVKATE